MKAYYTKNGVAIYHGDCREILPQLAGVDAIVTDPPYGIDHNTAYSFSGGVVAGNVYKPIEGDKQEFDPSFLLGYRKVLLFGANVFSGKLSPGSFLVWDKRQPGSQKNVMADAEIAWLNSGHGIYIYNHYWDGFVRQSERGENYHPTQKPVSLMIWCLQKVNPKGKVCDPFMGSGSTLLGCYSLGIPAIGIELEEEYCEIAATRLAKTPLPLTTHARERLTPRGEQRELFTNIMGSDGSNENAAP